MGLSTETKGLIMAVAKNDIQEAKRISKVILSKDTSKTNASYIGKVTNMLNTSSLNLLELPYDLKGLLMLEDVALSFQEDRYYLSQREKTIMDEILCMYHVGVKLSELNIHYVNSLMLYGESGTGKTMFGRYIAHKLGLPFAYVNFSNVIDSYLGSTSKNIQKVFSYIENNKCVLMLDEIDAIGASRGQDSIGEIGRITIGLMQCLDRVSNETVIVGATNRLESIDTALLRRFTMQHEVVKLNSMEMFDMIVGFLNAVHIKYDISDIKEYCNKTNCAQALIMNDLIRKIAWSIKEGKSHIEMCQ